jgi:hypothetical protein
MTMVLHPAVVKFRRFSAKTRPSIAHFLLPLDQANQQEQARASTMPVPE